MTTISAVQGDLTQQQVDAIVNAASTAMRGGGGVDGAIHRAAGPQLLQECIERFPNGMATGDAGWTHGWNLPAEYIIHTPGPNYGRGQTNPELLLSSYRRCLEVADQLGVKTIAFPLISAGVFRWPLRDAVRIAVDTLTSTPTNVEEIRLVALDKENVDMIEAYLTTAVPLRLIQAVRELHRRGYQGVRVFPAMAPSGMYWRFTITGPEGADSGALYYTTGNGTQIGNGRVTALSTPEEVADLILDVVPSLAAAHSDPEYATWYEGLVSLAEATDSLPYAVADWPHRDDVWEFTGSNAVYPLPPNSSPSQ